ncbi:integrin beta-1 isoform X3 [Oryzias melastigma]|uniref:integrin beta-1 isoform X3 n=1 Tax=Oryzias melastigma TaxID=30732 RepID=UPI000CF83A60|nr:integrin beta-1 isoform X3 [Oryzias melastigma]
MTSTRRDVHWKRHTCCFQKQTNQDPGPTSPRPYQTQGRFSNTAAATSRMAVKLLCLLPLLLLSCQRAAGTGGRVKAQTCVTSTSSCEECIQADPECAWCLAPQSRIRCHKFGRLQRAGCPEKYIYNPQSSMQVAKNESRKVPADSTPLFLQPQELSIQLRPGVHQSFPLNIFMTTDQATDLTLDVSGVPDGVNITFSSADKGNPLLVQVNVEAAQCPSRSDLSAHNRTEPWSVLITPRGSSLSVKLEISLLCTCGCIENGEENSSFCSNRGDFMCGKCHCHQPYFGQSCQLQEDSFFSDDESMCRSAADAAVCSGRGTCIEGSCECFRRENPRERYSGRFCECDNFNCPYHNGRICGGHGECVCGKCHCESNWVGEDCGCNSEITSCMGQNQLICSGRGLCQCGTCECYPTFRGQTCESLILTPP